MIVIFLGFCRGRSSQNPNWHSSCNTQGKRVEEEVLNVGVSVLVQNVGLAYTFMFMGKGIVICGGGRRGCMG